MNIWQYSWDEFPIVLDDFPSYKPPFRWRISDDTRQNPVIPQRSSPRTTSDHPTDVPRSQVHIAYIWVNIIYYILYYMLYIYCILYICIMHIYIYIRMYYEIYIYIYSTIINHNY